MGESEPLMQLETLPIASSTPAVLRAYEDAVEVRMGLSPVKGSVQRLRYDQIAQVLVQRGIFFADLVVETLGGGSLTVPQVSKREAEQASVFIRERMTSSPRRAHESAASVPDQIRQLAELRDSGAITEEEFQAKKKDLLDRM